MDGCMRTRIAQTQRACVTLVAAPTGWLAQHVDLVPITRYTRGSAYIVGSSQQPSS